MFWFVAKWSAFIVAGSIIGIGAVVAWDWLFWRRIPHVRWRMTQLPPNEINIIREITRVRRLKPPPPAVPTIAPAQVAAAAPPPAPTPVAPPGPPIHPREILAMPEPVASTAI